MEEMNVKWDWSREEKAKLFRNKVLKAVNVVVRDAMKTSKHA